MTRVSDEIKSLVLAHLLDAAQAVRQQDIEGAVRCLESAVVLYEQHPTFVHEPESQLRDLLVYIRAVKSISATLHRSEDDMRSAETRAEALRSSAFH
jgi:hypothetical protein